VILPEALSLMGEKDWSRREFEGQRLAAWFARHGLTPRGGCALFQSIATERTATLDERPARGGILTRLFTPPGLRFGLPGTETAWARLEAAAQTGNESLTAKT
jgi:cobalamin biosynthetic protein CobC